MFSFQLFSIASIFSTIRIAGLTLYRKYKQFLAVFSILSTLIILFSGAAFFFLRPNYINEELNENMCESWWRCFLTIFDYGLRAGGPFGTFSLAHDNNFYISIFFYDWIFFFLVNLLMLNLVNAIIVDAFQNFREEKANENMKIKNYCYICNIPNIMFRTHGVEFENHILTEHNITDYVNFLIKIYKENRFNLNSIQTSVKQLMGVGQVDFFPDKRALCFKNDKIFK